MSIGVRKWSRVEVRSTRCALSACPAARFPWLSIESGGARATCGRTVRVCELILWRALSESVTSLHQRVFMIIRYAWSTTAACTAARFSRLTIEGRCTGASPHCAVRPLHMRRPFAVSCFVWRSWPLGAMSPSWGCSGSNGAKAPTRSMRAIPHVDMQGHVL